MTDPRFKKFFERAKKFNYVQYKSIYQSLQYEKLYKILASLKNKLNVDASALDWGGGQGHCSLLLSDLQYKTTLFSIVSYDEPWQKLNKLGVDIAFQPKAVKMLDFDDKSFNISVSCGVLEHVRETGGKEVDSLRELSRVTTDYIVIYHLPNRYSWIEWVTRNFRPGVYSHPYRYTRKDIEKLASDLNDFEIESLDLYGVLPRRIGKQVKSEFFGYAIHLLDKMLGKTPLKHIGQAFCVTLKAK